MNDYFFADIYNAYPLVTLRIGLGLILLLQLIQVKADIFTFVGEYGLIRQDIVDVRLPSFVISTFNITNTLSSVFSISEIQAINYLGIAYAVSIIGLIVGLFTRFSAIMCWLLHLAFMNSAHFFLYGVDYFLTILLFYNVLFPVGRSFSIDNLLFKYKPINATPYVRILQIHMCIVYFVSGIAKAIGPNWWNGISIWKAINRPVINDYQVSFLAKFEPLLTAAGIATVVIEVLYIVFMNVQKTRKVWLFLTCALHLSIAFLLALPYFAAVMILFNVAAYSYGPKEKYAGEQESLVPATI